MNLRAADNRDLSNGRAAPGRARRRPPPRPVEVLSVARLAPRLVSVVVGGEALEGFGPPAPTSHVKAFLPPPGRNAPVLPQAGPDGLVWPEEAPRPVVRTYTPRRFDERAGTLEVQFVLHGTGPASEWAERARPGDRLGIAGPGGRFSLDPTVRSWWIAGDESALPAIGTLLEALPPSASADVHLEVAGPDDEVPLASPADLSVSWHHRGQPDGWGDRLYQAAHDAAIAVDTRIWVACEAAAVRRIRGHFVERQMPASAMVTRGYWRAGEANHPDHDYGED